MQNGFFRQLTQDLQQHGTGMPQLIVDMSAFMHNLKVVKTALVEHLNTRLVVKSLACIELLKQASIELGTQRFMVFHALHLDILLQYFPDADILFGKPMPARAMAQFYQQYPQHHGANIQWLLDTPVRLQQYLHHAEALQLCLQVNIEIDVGLHRGGIGNLSDFKVMLNIIKHNMTKLKLSGLMGYDAHVTKIPKLIQSQAQAYAESQTLYRQYQDFIAQYFPSLWHSNLCFNGGGSPTFMLHSEQSVCNDVAFGSMLLKPSDFDDASLGAFRCALWIATPVLKVLDYAQLPAMDMLNKLPHWFQAVFVYGGYWRADYVYPSKSRPHLLYGRSSNQEMVHLPKSISIQVDDYVFLRPQQSEAILPQFAHLYAYEQGSFNAWETFRE